MTNKQTEVTDDWGLPPDYTAKTMAGIHGGEWTDLYGPDGWIMACAPSKRKDAPTIFRTRARAHWFRAAAQDFCAGFPADKLMAATLQEFIDAVQALVLSAVNHNVADTRGFSIGCGLCSTVMDRAGLHKDWCPVAQVEAVLAKLRP